MPWHPQGLHNLRWWAAMAPVPVVGIGGVLAVDQVTGVAGSGAACACLVRALAPGPVEAPTVAQRLVAAVAGWTEGRLHQGTAPRWPRASLDPN
jgi:hydroxymethylpyrimidine kinase/phosphomethylpyrimidine kinase/thiamine-phosphate diphosphorylase